MTDSPRPRSANVSAPPAARRRLGSVSEVFESGGRGPGAVSTGGNDPGGVSYGIYQFASRTGTLAAFLKQEGSRWAAELGASAPGGAEFSAAWKAIARREPVRFRDAQHAFIERTHYRRAVGRVKARMGIDLDERRDAVREAVWSVAVQHGKAADILCDAVTAADRQARRGDPSYDRRLVEAIYRVRTAYVLKVAAARKKGGERDQLVSITKKRYPAELAACLKMFDRV